MDSSRVTRLGFTVLMGLCTGSCASTAQQSSARSSANELAAETGPGSSQTARALGQQLACALHGAEPFTEACLALAREVRPLLRRSFKPKPTRQNSWDNGSLQQPAESASLSPHGLHRSDGFDFSAGAQREAFRAEACPNSKPCEPRATHRRAPITGSHRGRRRGRSLQARRLRPTATVVSVRCTGRHVCSRRGKQRPRTPGVSLDGSRTCPARSPRNRP